jgi:hypothetical protein
MTLVILYAHPKRHRQEVPLLMKEEKTMEKSRLSRVCVVALTTICLLSTMSALYAQEAAPLAVESAAICTYVVEREPIDSGTVFPASVGKLYCFTKIINADAPTVVTHVWYYGDAERARVSLRISSATWRTYSSKIIQSHESGIWYVDVLGPDGNRLTSMTFEITP